MDRVSFTAMKDGTAEDYAFLNEHEVEYARGTADRLQMVLWRLDALDEEQMARLTERRSRDRDEAEHQRRSAPVAAPSVPVDVLVGPHLGGQQ